MLYECCLDVSGSLAAGMALLNAAALTYIAGLYADKNTEYEVTTSWEAFWSSAEKHF